MPAPMACKGLDAILSQIDPTAEVIRRIRPVYHFKAVTESLSESIKTALSAFSVISKSVRSFFYRESFRRLWYVTITERENKLLYD